MRGSVQVNSELGQGSTFSVRLPKEQVASIARPQFAASVDG
jgi:signal transduction histidine kinase